MRRPVSASARMPVTGMRPSAGCGNRWVQMASPTARGWPCTGYRCISRLGPALTSTMAPPCSSMGWRMSCSTMSMPAMSRPMVRAAMMAWWATSGWTSSVQSTVRLPVRSSSTSWPAAGTDSGCSCWRCSSTRILAFCDSSMRSSVMSTRQRGCWLIWASTSSATVDWPSPTTPRVSPRVAATTWWPTTSTRCSWPRMQRSTSTWVPSRLASCQAASIEAWSTRSRLTPRARLPSSGLTTTGTPRRWAICQAWAGDAARSPWGVGMPALASRRLVRALSEAMSWAMAPVWSLSAVQMRCCAAPMPSCTRLPLGNRR